MESLKKSLYVPPTFLLNAAYCKKTTHTLPESISTFACNTLDYEQIQTFSPQANELHATVLPFGRLLHENLRVRSTPVHNGICQELYNSSPPPEIQFFHKISQCPMIYRLFPRQGGIQTNWHLVPSLPSSWISNDRRLFPSGSRTTRILKDNWEDRKRNYNPEFNVRVRGINSVTRFCTSCLLRGRI
jgi:hypothetical protein